MKNQILVLIIFSLIFFQYSCGIGQTKEVFAVLPPTEFQEHLSKNSDALVLDVRTPAEYNKGHIKNAKNINFNSPEFSADIETLDKNKPVFVYCLSGGRSAAALDAMKKKGFHEVYNLGGGTLAWNSAGFPLELTENAIANNASSNGISLEKYNEMTKSDKVVVVDFYADWCAPCKKMKPYLDEISDQMSDKVNVIRINADSNSDLCKALKIDGLPVIQIFKQGKLSWENKGYITKEELLSHF
ncbi:MAG: thioredoxin fold domain-containing protein [Saprospiraceae bacterium]|nr:thioredoxin fold domain-containing protein [Saprospiraceae bacterium]